MIYRTLQIPALGAAQAADAEYETCRFGAFDLSDLRGPSIGAAQAAGTEYETCRFRAFDLSDLAGPGVGGCSAHAPEPPRAFLFLLEEKEAKDYLGGSPLKTPRGSALAASP